MRGNMPPLVLARVLPRVNLARDRRFQPYLRSSGDAGHLLVVLHTVLHSITHLATSHQVAQGLHEEADVGSRGCHAAAGERCAQAWQPPAAGATASRLWRPGANAPACRQVFVLQYNLTQAGVPAAQRPVRACPATPPPARASKPLALASALRSAAAWPCGSGCCATGSRRRSRPLALLHLAAPEQSSAAPPRSCSPRCCRSLCGSERLPRWGAAGRPAPVYSVSRACAAASACSTAEGTPARGASALAGSLSRAVALVDACEWLSARTRRASQTLKLCSGIAAVSRAPWSCRRAGCAKLQCCAAPV